MCVLIDLCAGSGQLYGGVAGGGGGYQGGQGAACCSSNAPGGQGPGGAASGGSYGCSYIDVLWRGVGLCRAEVCNQLFVGCLLWFAVQLLEALVLALVMPTLVKHQAQAFAAHLVVARTSISPVAPAALRTDRRSSLNSIVCALLYY
jgi:hypothetical protein